MQNQYGVFSSNSSYNIIIIIFLVFLISVIIRALLTLNFEKLLKPRRTKNKDEMIDAKEMHQLDPTTPEDLSAITTGKI